jgi:hypothetical protein
MLTSPAARMLLIALLTEREPWADLGRYRGFFADGLRAGQQLKGRAAKSANCDTWIEDKETSAPHEGQLGEHDVKLVESDLGHRPYAPMVGTAR